MGGTTGLAPEQLAALDRIADLASDRGLHMVGGSAVAYHLGHRQSEHLDLFSSVPELDLEALRRSLIALFPDLQIRGSTDVTLRVIAGGAVIDLVRYPYPPLEPPTPGPAGVMVAGLRDLAVMKLAAIANRGIRRDFWDLFAIAGTGLSLSSMTRDYLRRFGRQESDLYHVFRSLTFFADAESDPLYPRGLTPEHWQEIKAYFEKEVPALIRGTT